MEGAIGLSYGRIGAWARAVLPRRQRPACPLAGFAALSLQRGAGYCAYVFLRGFAALPLFIGLVPLALTPACRDEKPAPFLLEVDVRPSANAPDGLSFMVNGEVTTRIWEGSFTSLEAACAHFEENPLEVACQDLLGESCGESEVFGVCCWAPNVLASPVVKGTLYVFFDGDGNATVEEGFCDAKDGSSTHSDDDGPDAGI